jgi:hypothetical protein
VTYHESQGLFCDAVLPAGAVDGLEQLTSVWNAFTAIDDSRGRKLGGSKREQRYAGSPRRHYANGSAQYTDPGQGSQWGAREPCETRPPKLYQEPSCTTVEIFVQQDLPHRRNGGRSRRRRRVERTSVRIARIVSCWCSYRGKGDLMDCSPNANLLRPPKSCPFHYNLVSSLKLSANWVGQMTRCSIHNSTSRHASRITLS